MSILGGFFWSWAPLGYLWEESGEKDLPKTGFGHEGITLWDPFWSTSGTLLTSGAHLGAQRSHLARQMPIKTDAKKSGEFEHVFYGFWVLFLEGGPSISSSRLDGIAYHNFS